MSKEDEGQATPSDQPQAQTQPEITLEMTAQQMLGASYREYGTLALQINNLKEQLSLMEKRAEEVRQHIAALETTMKNHTDLKKSRKAAAGKPN